MSGYQTRASDIMLTSRNRRRDGLSISEMSMTFCKLSSWIGVNSQEQARTRLPASQLYPFLGYRRLCCASSAGEIHQSHNPDGNLLLSVGARSQLVSLVAQDWAVRATLVMYATIFRPCAYLALWILFKALHAFFSPVEWKKKAENGLY
ncbi:hypothetical protein B0H13DRAFT_1869940 [Mycena leptocephala]|nr:hypothetical protein B0H13DRAFT_1869940 [Mycena leptocephala]